MHRHTDALQQLGEALEFEAHHRPADVVGVMVGDQDAGQVHAVGLERVDQILGGVGGVDDDAVAGLAVADQVGEVAHLLGDHVVGREVAAGQQLPEVQAHQPRLGSRPHAGAPRASVLNQPTTSLRSVTF